MPNVDDMSESKYLKQSDVGDGKILTIAGVKKVNVALPDEEPEYKWTLEFEHGVKPMVLNKINRERIALYLGARDTDLWLGKKILVWADPDVEYGGKITGGLRVKRMAGPSNTEERARKGAKTAPGEDFETANRELQQRAAASHDSDDEAPF
jgi:hypothetical protein